MESQWRYQPEPETQPEPEIPSEPEPAAEIPVEAPVEEPAEAELPESPEDALERMIMEGTQNVDPSNDATIQVDLSAIKKAAAQRYGYETAAELDGVPVELMEEIIETTEPETPEEAVKKRNTMTEMEKAREEYFKMLDQELSGVQVKVEVEVKPNTTVERHTTILDSRDVAAAEAEDNVVETTAEVEVPAPEVSAEEPKAAEPEEEIVWPLDPSQYEEEEERGGFFSVLGKILLAVIALVIALEIGALAILYFAPDSAMAGKVYVVQEKVLGLMDSLKNGDDGEDDPVIDDQTQADQEGEAGQEEPNGEAGTADPVTDTAPMTDKTALIQTQIGKNKNIKSITANDALTYKSGANYGIEDLNDSKPIENNLWYTKEDGTPVYYDQEVVGALIAFNSQWVDYVNEGDKAALDLTKEGSDAYNQAVNFSKAGKVKEEFVSVQIGEIRQGQNGFYLWAAEEIKLTENGETKTANYKWVYCMEPVGKEMKITDYISVKNI